MKVTEYGKNARIKLSSGVNNLSKAVRVTLGPAGRNVFIKLKGQAPFSTKDGVTVASAYASQDIFEQIAVEAVQKVSADTDAVTGDGTTTATVIAEYILRKGLDFPERLNLLDIKKGIDEATIEIVKMLKENSIPCETPEDLYEVALVSSNYDKEISQAVIDAFKISGKQGIVNIKRSKDLETTVSSVEGMNLPTGMRSKDFMNDYENEICEFDDAYVFMTNKKISQMTPNMDFLLEHVSENNKNLLIICKDMDVLFMNMLIQNKRKGSINVCVVRAPGFGNEQKDLLFDIGAALGATPFIEATGDEVGLSFDELDQDAILDYIPVSPKVFVSEQSLSINALLEQKPQMLHRADMLREKLENVSNSYEKSQLQARISRLTDGIAFINIGCSTDIEFTEKQHRIQDALYAVKSANNEGIVPGGGAALFSLSKKLIAPENESKAYGYKIMKEAIRMPLIQICSNAGKIIEHEKLSIFKKILFYFTKNKNDYIDETKIDVMTSIFNYGYNVLTEDIENMIDAKIIDPVKVTRVAVQNASSISGLLLTTECVIADDSSYENKTMYNE